MDHATGSLLEKAKCNEIYWHYLLHPQGDDLIPLLLWDGCNLLEKDQMLTRICLGVSYPISSTGIHLRKMLSPSMVSFVDLLGVCVCLAQCCMPRAVTKVAQRNILGEGRNKKSTKAAVEKHPSFKHGAVFETLLETEDRMIGIQRRDAVRRRQG
jgi:hypothetical protein